MQVDLRENTRKMCTKFSVPRASYRYWHGCETERKRDQPVLSIEMSSR